MNPEATWVSLQLTNSDMLRPVYDGLHFRNWSFTIKLLGNRNMEHKIINEIDLKWQLSRKNIIMDFFYTIVICTAIALALSMSNSRTTFLTNFIMSQSIGLTNCSIILLMLWVFQPRRWLTLISVIFTAVITGVIIGLNIGFFILEKTFSIIVNLPMKDLLQIILSAIIFSGSALSFFIFKSRLRLRNEMIEQEKNKCMAAEKE